MAEGGDDIKIKVGAEADAGDATAKILSEFDKMSRRLKTVATEEAQALAEQISAVTKGLREGTVDAKSVEDVALAFSKIEKTSALSDKAIDGFTSKLKDAVYRSRSLSDQMREVEKESAKSGGFADNLKDSIRDVAPEAAKISDETGKWLNRLPGVNSLIKSMGGAAGAVGSIFLAITAAVVAAAKAMKDWGAEQREAAQRFRDEKDEDFSNRMKNLSKELDLKAADRKAEYEHRKAMAELEAKSVQAYRQKADYIAEMTSQTSKQRDLIIQSYDRHYAELANDAERQQLEADQTENAALQEDIKNRQKLLEEESEQNRKRLEEEQALLDKSDTLRSRLTKNAELREKLAQQGVDVETATLDKIKETVGGWAEDALTNVKSWFTGDMGTDEADEEYRKRRANVRSMTQRGAELKQSAASLATELKSAQNEGELIKRGIEENDVNKDLIDMKYDARTHAMMRERDERMGEMRTDAMKNGNRLTAMGLGGGNAGADPAKDTARNTHEIVGVLKEMLHKLDGGGGKALDGRRMDMGSGVTWTL